MRISLIVSSENSILPLHIRDIIPEVRVFYMDFVPGRGDSERERRRIFQQLSRIKKDVEESDYILYGRSYGTFSQEGWKQMKAFFSRPVILSTESVIHKLRSLKSKRVFVMTPYNQVRHDYEVKWITSFGFQVIGSVALGRKGGKAISSTS